MENRNWDNRRRGYNERWDDDMNRDRYRRDAHQNRGRRSGGYSYDRSEYGRSGDYTGNDFNRYNDNRYGYGQGSGGSASDYERRYGRSGRSTHYGYAENKNSGIGRRGYYEGIGNDYGQTDFDQSRSGWGQGSDWRGSGSNQGYGGSRYGSGHYERGRDYHRNRGDYGSYSGGADYNRHDSDWDEDRDWWDRTTDEVSSWFGDDEAKRRREMDRMMDHRGKGVKGYQRSDERIKSDIEDDLYHDSYVDPSDMVVTVRDGVVTLSGSVDSKWAKRRAEDMAETVAGVKDVTNELTVRKEQSSYSAGGTMATGGTGTEGSITSNTSYKTGKGTKSTEV